MISLTTVTVIDAKLLDHFHTVIENWRLLRPELWHLPMVVIYDAKTIDIPAESCMLLDHPDCHWFPWPLFDEGGFRNRKHFLDSAHFIGVAYCVETQWWLKLDADTFAEDVDWLDPMWLDGDCEIIGQRSSRGRDFFDLGFMLGTTELARRMATTLDTNSIPDTFERWMKSSTDKIHTVKKMGWKRQSRLPKLRVAVAESLNGCEQNGNQRSPDSQSAV